MSERPNQIPKPWPSTSDASLRGVESVAGRGALDQVFQSYSPEEQPIRQRLEPVSPAEFESTSRRESREPGRQRAQRPQRETLSDRIDNAIMQHFEVDHEQHARRLQRRFRWFRNALGLAAALLLLQLIAWWLPNNQGSDPFGFATMLPERFAAAAPEYLRNQELPGSGENSASQTGDQPQDSPTPEHKLTDTKSDSPAPVTSLKPESDDASVTKTSGSESVNDSEAAAAKEKNDKDSDVEPADVAPQLDDDWQTQMTQSTATEETLDELMDTLRELDNLGLDQRRVAAKKLFDGLCTVGGELRIPFADTSQLPTAKLADSQRGAEAAAKSVLSAIATAPEKVAFVSRAGIRRLEDLSSEDPGIVMVGKVRSILESRPGIWILALVSPHEPDQQLSIHISDRHLSSTISTGDSILLLGYQIQFTEAESESKNVHIKANVVYPVKSSE